MNEITVKLTGPMFDGSGYRISDSITSEIIRHTAVKTDEDLQLFMRATFRKPKGYYWSKVYVDRVTADMAHITDSGVIYGPWLEGTSSRNQTSRFKGYYNFRRAVYRSIAKIPGYGDHVLNRRLRELG